MFTGIVEDTAEVTEVAEAEEGRRISLESDCLDGVERGESVSVSGACLTVEEHDEDRAKFFLGAETLEKTWFDSLEEGDRVNVERSLTPSDRMGGHIVQGHVESTAETTEVTDTGEGWEMEFEKPGSLENYIVEKGFVAVEGISLTVKDVWKNSFSVMVIPETWEITNLDQKSKGERVNIETDVTARYVEKMID